MASKNPLTRHHSIVWKLNSNIDWLYFWDLLILWERERRVSWWHVKIYEKVRCICWNEYFTRREHIMWWRTKNCWCKKIKRITNIGKNNTIHGMEWTPFYRKYQSILARCYNKNNDSYIHYWWRGITCEWGSFIGFYNDMYQSYLEHLIKYWKWNTSIDRINVDGNYCKENCRWATREVQQNNKRNTVFYEYKWEWKSLAQWNKIHWKRLIYDRVKSN